MLVRHGVDPVCGVLLWWILVTLQLDGLSVSGMLGAVTRIDRMVSMFQYAIVLCVHPSKEAVVKLQRHIAESG